jgi:hypothetical protein
MKTLKEYIIETEALGQPTRRGFLKGLASFAAAASVPAPVVKLLSTPAGVASLPIPAGIALLKGIQNHLDQWDAEDDDDYYEAWEDLAGELGFEDKADGESAHDQLADLIILYDKNPNLAASQLIKQIQSNVINPGDVKSSLVSRDKKKSTGATKDADNKPYGFGYDSWEAENTPEQNKIIVYTTDFDGNIARISVSDNRKTDPITALNRTISNAQSNSAFYKYSKFTVTNGGKPVKISTTSPKYIDPSKLSNKLTPAQVGEKLSKMFDRDPHPRSEKKFDHSIAANNASTAAARLAGLTGGAGASTNQAPAPTATVKNMGPVQYAKDTPALPAPAKPEFDLNPNLKPKEKVPAAGKDRELDESVELSSILKNAGLKK